MNIVPVQIPLSETGGIGIEFDIKVNDNLTLHLITVNDNKPSFTQDEFMQTVSTSVFNDHGSWNMGKKMAVIKYFRKMGSRAEPQERGVMIAHLNEIMNTAADRYDSYCKARGNKNILKPVRYY